jgi:hypothetical protein
LLLVLAPSLKQRFKTIFAIFIGLGGCYLLAWFTIFSIAPVIGTDAELLTYIGVGGLSFGIAI